MIALSSCSDGNENSSNITISGKWYQRESVIDGVVFPYDDNEVCGKDYLQFYGSNSVKSVDVFDCTLETDWSGNYSINGNLLTITVNGQSADFEINSLTKSYLELKFSTDINNDGVSEIHIEKYDK